MSDRTGFAKLLFVDAMLARINNRFAHLYQNSNGTGQLVRSCIMTPVDFARSMKTGLRIVRSGGVISLSAEPGLPRPRERAASLTEQGIAMRSKYVYHHQAPALWPLYGRALIPKKNKPDLADLTIPPLAAELLGVHTDGAHLTRYRSICGFVNQTALPITWIHVLAFPLHLRLLTDPRFPLPLPGLVHLRNEITQRRPISAGECLDIQVNIAGQTATDKGWEFDLMTTAYSAGRCVWKERSTNLFRTPGGKAAEHKAPLSELPRYQQNESIAAAESVGRHYGKVSGDLNPIHMHAMSARVFGFPRAIAHGMWSKARCLAILAQQPGWSSAPVTVACQFKKPLFLPGSAQLDWQEGSKQWPFQLLDTTGNAPHLSGDVRRE